MVRAKKRDPTLARLPWASAAVGFAVALLWVIVLAPVVQLFSLALAGLSGELLIPFSLCVFPRVPSRSGRLYPARCAASA